LEIIERSASARRHAAVFLVLVTALVPVAIFASAAGATGTTTKLRPKVCGNVSGLHWSWGGRSGTQYAVYAVKGAPCSVALRWVPRLLPQRPHTPDKRGADLTGPPGWGCLDTSQSIPHSGYCVSGTDTQFGWGPFVKR
jgi:hypothetical protein